MKSTLSVVALAMLAIGTSLPASARHAVPMAAQQALALKDGSTLYVMKDGKMAKEDRYGRAINLKSGDTLQLADGRQITAVGNEVARLENLLSEGHRN